MSQNNQADQIMRQIEYLLHLLRDERASQARPGRPSIRPIHTWDEQTRHLRFAEKVKLHRNPEGLANTTRWRRDRMVASYRERIHHMDGDAVAAEEALHEAVAYAVDAERFLGSFDHQDARGRFPVEDVDDVATHVLVWLEERGYRIVLMEGGR